MHDNDMQGHNDAQQPSWLFFSRDVLDLNFRSLLNWTLLYAIGPPQAE